MSGFIFYISELEDKYFLIYLDGCGVYDTSYKCDQIDGVKELLIDKEIIKG